MPRTLFQRLFSRGNTNLYFLAAPFRETEMPEWDASLLLVKVTNEEQLYLAFSNPESAAELKRLIGDDRITVVPHSELNPRIQRDFTRHNLLVLRSPALVAQYWRERDQFPFGKYRAASPQAHAV